jgi:hypothetical protein
MEPAMEKASGIVWLEEYSIIVPMAKISPVKRNLVVSRLRDGPPMLAEVGIDTCK